jgi:acyl-CoA reductase-like NAD-dependent aldehyde dehydrogenase
MASELAFASVNPATEQEIARWPVADAAARDRALDTAVDAFRAGRDHSPDDRAALLRSVAAELRSRRVDLAATATAEMGKPRGEALAEVDKCATGCEYFAEHGAAMLADEPHPSNATQSYVSYLPLGVIFAVMPWNYPYWQVIRHAAPAVMAGNAILVKHAENTLGCAAALTDVFIAAGAHPGLLAHVAATVDDSAEIIGDRRVAAVTLTGSTRAGSAVATLAGKSLKKTVLELGGSDAFVVLADADVPAAAKTAARARFQNAGQSCIAAKRFIVERAVADEFIDAFIADAADLQVGDPAQDGVDLGPMARDDLRAGLARQRAASIAAGAKELLVGGPRDGVGWYFDPSVLLVEDLSVPAWREETFGPLAPIHVVDSAERALAVVNDSIYGLGGAVWTGDLDRGRAFARRVESGAMFVNGMTASYPELPFGGVKQSGYGRELARAGIVEFTNQQTVWVAPSAGI